MFSLVLDATGKVQSFKAIKTGVDYAATPPAPFMFVKPVDVERWVPVSTLVVANDYLASTGTTTVGRGWVVTTYII